MQLTCELACWLLLVFTLFVNAAATKLVIKKTSAMITNKKSTNRDLLLVALTML